MVLQTQSQNHVQNYSRDKNPCFLRSLYFPPIVSVGYFLGTISQSNKVSSCHNCNCVEDDKERTIKAQIEMNCLTRKNGWESLLYSTLASKHKSQFQL